MDSKRPNFRHNLGIFWVRNASKNGQVIGWKDIMLSLSNLMISIKMRMFRWVWSTHFSWRSLYLNGASIWTVLVFKRARNSVIFKIDLLPLCLMQVLERMLSLIWCSQLALVTKLSTCHWWTSEANIILSRGEVSLWIIEVFGGGFFSFSFWVDNVGLRSSLVTAPKRIFSSKIVLPNIASSTVISRWTQFAQSFYSPYQETLLIQNGELTTPKWLIFSIYSMHMYIGSAVERQNVY